MVPAERGRGNTKKQKFGKQKAEIEKRACAPADCPNFYFLLSQFLL
jgi:hypothetical protein